MAVSNKTVASNIFWRYAERMLAQGMTFIISLVLARILEPSEYGLIAIVGVIIAIFGVFSTRGFVQALIQKKEIDSLDYSTVFFSNLIIEILLYCILYISAPYIAKFYNNDALTLITRILGIRLFINVFNSIQQAYAQRNMQFKKFFYSTTIGTLVSGILGIYMALKGFRVWALVVQSLAGAIIGTSVLFLIIDWRPKLEFSFERLKKMLSYGIKMLVSGLLEAFYNEIRSLVIGKAYSVSDLAFYNKGQRLPSLVVSNLQTSISNVFFAALARENSFESTKEKMRSYLRIVFYCLSPLMFGLALVAYPLIAVLYTEKWIEAAPYIIIYSFSYLTWIPQMTWLQAINSRGKAGTTLKLMIVHRFVGISLIILLLSKGPIYIALSALFADCFITLLIYLTVKKIFSYTFKELYDDIYKTIIQTLIMSVIVWFCSQLALTYISKLLISVSTGILAYISLSIILKNKNYIIIKNNILKILKKQNKNNSV